MHQEVPGFPADLKGMDAIAVKPGSKRDTPSYKRVSFPSVAAVLGLFVVLDLATVPGLIGDTLVYVGQMITYSQGGPGASPSLLWEFGHLLWRPLGYALWKLAMPLLAWWFAGNPILEITAVLFAINFVFGAILAGLVFAICRRLGLETGRAFAVTAGILVSNAFLNWVHSGSAYVPGLAFSVAGIWLLVKAAQEPKYRTTCSILSGGALALSFGIWFPFILSVPAALLLALLAGIASDDESAPAIRARIRVAGLAAVAAAVLGIVVFATGAAICHISSVSEFKQWVINSGHGVSQERSLVRFPSGITRTFLYLGDEGTVLKRFVFGDPYAPVRWIDLLGAGLWKVGLVFVSFCVLFWNLLRTREGRPALGVVLAGMLPTIAFAILLFETSGSERYFPFYPALLVGICIALRQRTARSAHLMLAAFLVIMILVNLKAFAWDLRGYTKASSERFSLVHNHTRHGGVALILSFRDPLSTYFQRSPFRPENQVNALPLYHVIDPELLSAGTWRSGTSCRVLQAWTAGGDAWMSKRLVAPRPQPDWQWVENDRNSIRWTGLYDFFARFDIDENMGGSDGFLRMARDAKNQALLQASCSSGAAAVLAPPPSGR